MRMAYTLGAVLSISLATSGLGALPLALDGEVRRAEVARAASVASPFAQPRANAQPTLTAPLMAWVARPVFASAAPARPSPAALRAIPAAFLLALAILVYFLGRGWFSPHKGLLAAMLVLASPAAAEAGRAFTPDVAIACGLTAAIGSSITAIRAVSGRRFLAFLGTAALGNALAFTASGLAGPLTALLTLTVAIFAERGVRGLFTLRALSILTSLVIGLVAGAAVTLPVFAAEPGAPSLIGGFLAATLRDMVRASGDAGPSTLVYRALLLPALLPAALFAFYAGRGRIHQLAPGNHPELPFILLIAWALVPTALLIVGGRPTAMALTALPPLALLAGSAILEPPPTGKDGASVRIIWLLLRFGLAVSLLVLPIGRPLLALYAGDAATALRWALPAGLALALVLVDRRSEVERAAPLRSPTATIGAILVLLLSIHTALAPSHEAVERASADGVARRLSEAIGRAPDDGVRLHGLPPAIGAALAWATGAPVRVEDDPEVARAFLLSSDATARLLTSPAAHDALGRPGRLEAEVGTPLGRISIIRADPMAPSGTAAPSAPTGTAAPK